MNERISQLATQYKAVKEKHEALTKELKIIVKDWDGTEKELLDAMVEEGVNSVALDGLGKFSMSTRNHLSVTAEHKPDFYQYLKLSGNGGLLKEDVNPRTLSAFLKEHMETLATTYCNSGLNPTDARQAALKFLNEKGASYFSERKIMYRGECT